MIYNTQVFEFLSIKKQHVSVYDIKFLFAPEKEGCKVASLHKAANNATVSEPA